jgi:hypothetical protein
MLWKREALVDGMVEVVRACKKMWKTFCLINVGKILFQIKHRPKARLITLTRLNDLIFLIVAN